MTRLRWRVAYRYAWDGYGIAAGAVLISYALWSGQAWWWIPVTLAIVATELAWPRRSWQIREAIAARNELVDALTRHAGTDLLVNSMNNKLFTVWNRWPVIAVAQIDDDQGGSDVRSVMVYEASPYTSAVAMSAQAWTTDPATGQMFPPGNSGHRRLRSGYMPTSPAEIRFLAAEIFTAVPYDPRKELPDD